MTAILPSNYFGASVAITEVENNDTRIYYQSADGAIYHTGGVGSVASSARYYAGVVVVPAANVRFNTPIAVVTWGGKTGQTRLYFIDRINRVRELCCENDGNFVPGGLDEMEYKAAPNSGFLYAIRPSSGNLRVGFQSADAPGVITEAEHTGLRWASARLA